TLKVDRALSAANVNVAGGTFDAGDALTVEGDVSLSDGALNVAGGMTAANLNVSGGALTAGGGATADTLQLSGGAVILCGGDLGVRAATVLDGALDTGSHQLVVSESLKLARATLSIDAAPSFQVSGADVANQRTVTLTGGKLTVPGALPVAGAIGAWTFEEGSGDVVHDDVSPALDLTIEDPALTSWGAGFLSVNTGNDQPETIVQSAGAATKISDAVKASNAFTIEAWVVPENTDQGGPARIAGISWDGSNRNFSLVQDQVQWGMRFRTTDTNNNGSNPQLTTGSLAVVGELTHLVYTRDASGDEALYVNNVAEATRNRGGNTSNWNSGYPMLLGNERNLGGNREWTGEYHRLVIYDFALTQEEVDLLYGFGKDAAIVDLPNTHFLVTTNTVLDLKSPEPAALGNLALAGGAELTLTGAPAVSLGDLGGSGTVTGADVSVAGTVSPGDVVGTLALTGSLEAAAGTVLEWQAGPTGGDLLDVGGDLLLPSGGAPWVLRPKDMGTTSGAPFVVATYGGTLPGGLGDYAIDPTFVENWEIPTELELEAVAGEILLKGVTSIAPLQWKSDAGGSHNDPDNWYNKLVPDGTDAQANFLEMLQASDDVTVDTAVTLGGIKFRNLLSSYTIQGPGTITMETSVGDPLIVVEQGAHTIAAPLEFAALTVETHPGASLTLTQSGMLHGNLTKTGGGSALLDSGLIMYGEVNVDQGILEVTPDVLATGGGTVSIADGATLKTSGDVNRRVLGVPGDAGLGVLGSTLEIAGPS
ncbi:MAG: LamG domain-containing protein, partial [Planctomycetota bacterium]